LQVGKTKFCEKIYEFLVHKFSKRYKYKNVSGVKFSYKPILNPLSAVPNMKTRICEKAKPQVSKIEKL